ncbi:MAG: HAMP domain-containing histidine kinase [Firmicutes bacterium]|nr:HAMP domain-containing histidine kinase [Bacillota bacterium]
MKKNSVKTGRVKNNNAKVFNRITLIVVLGLFALLTVSSLVTFGMSAFLARWMRVDENNVLVYGMLVLLMSIVFGFALSFAYSAVMIKASRPYLEALQRIAECDFSARITDSSVFANFGIAQNFNNMAEQLENVETLRENFISDFSHEFKTPIVSISGFAKLLKDPTLTKEQRDEYLDVIIDESDRLVGLSESVLMLNRLDTIVVVKENYRLDEQLRQCVLMFDKQLREKNISLNMELEDAEIYSNEKLLSQVWVNLMSNAVKFTPFNGTVSVACSVNQSEICVSVEDSGCGMSREVLSNIFNKFYQGDNSHTTTGNGLGLSIVKKIVDLLEGTIEVTSEPDNGSKFVIKFAAVK